MNIPVFISLIVILSLAGCITPHKDPAVGLPETYIISPTLVPSHMLDKKIAFLENFLQKNSIPDGDKSLASNLLETYYLLKKLSRQSADDPDSINEEEYHNIILSLFNRLGDIDEKYFIMHETPARDYAEQLALLDRKKYQVLNSYLARDFKEALNHCIGIKELFGPDAVSEEINAVCALSLAKEGMIKEALMAGHEAADKLESFPDIIYLRSEMAKWELMLGQTKKAARQFEKLNEIIKTREASIRSLGRKLSSAPREQQAPAFRADTRLELSMAQFLETIEKLIQQNSFSEARELLVLKSMEISSKNDIGVIDQALKHLETAEEKYLENKISGILKKNDTVDSGSRLPEEEPENVISGLDAVESETEFLEMKEEAVERLINQERNRAARIFLTAKNTEDPRKKEEYLRSCHDILRGLIEKYPQSPLNHKLKSHLEAVDEEMNRIEKASPPFFEIREMPFDGSNH